MLTGKVLIAEDHPMFRDGLEMIVQELATECQVLCAGDFQTAWKLGQQHPDLDLLLLDLKLPGTQGLDGLTRFREAFQLCPIVVISMLEMAGNVRNVMDLGANGFIAKSTPRDGLMAGLRQVLEGHIVTITDDPTPVVKLTPRQVEVLGLVKVGKSNKEIAKILLIADSTVREHLSEAMSLLRVSNRTQVVLEAQRLGLILE